jgi:hypothetical protein
LPAVWQCPIVIDDHVAPIGNSVIQMFQGLHPGTGRRRLCGAQ